MGKRLLRALGVCAIVGPLMIADAGAQSLSTGVSHESSQGNHHLKVNLNDIHTKMGVSYSQPLNQLTSTLSHAERSSRDGFAVVGAVNATFFDMNHRDQPSFSLITDHNKIINYGRNSPDSSHYRQHPIAFGITGDGTAMIDRFDSRLRVSSGSREFSIHNMNAERSANSVSVYTSQFVRDRTGTNEYGVEVVVRGVGRDTVQDFGFGDVIEGTVETVGSYGEPGNSRIPSSGFVLSGHGDGADHLRHLSPGDSVKIEASIDSKWRDAELMLGSGPQLVRNGQVDVSMDLNSWRAQQVTERAAVGVSRDGQEVFMVTTRNMNMLQLAEHMKNLGAHAALNFDGGGSSTLVGRQDNDLGVLNRTGWLRSVPSALLVGYTGDLSVPVQASISIGSGNQFLVGSTFPVSVDVLNGIGQKISSNESSGELRVSASVGEVANGQVKVQHVGSGGISYSVEGSQIARRPVSSTDTIHDFGLPTTITTSVDGRTNLEVSPKDSNGNEIRYDGLQVEKEVVGNVGRIDSRGSFHATNSGEGEVVITIGPAETRVPVTVAEASPFQDVSTSHPSYESILFGVDRGFFRGYSDQTFRPSQNVLRQHVAAVLVREFGLEDSTVSDPGYKDVSETHGMYSEIAIATEEGWIRGSTSTGKFNPGNNLTRGQMALILYRAYDLGSVEGDIEFKDVTPNMEQYEAIRALASIGVTTGYSDGTFRPSDPISRAHFATFMHRLINHFEE
ncbi:hypothetical protein DH09_10645 [Bacillaceae bacterium JMAK1]|nr:hypothetical protein DH09_10645 [Bacillaceae bacterium JMAK1]